jgi:hypothetical protein
MERRVDGPIEGHRGTVGDLVRAKPKDGDADDTRPDEDPPVPRSDVDIDVGIR